MFSINGASGSGHLRPPSADPSSIAIEKIQQMKALLDKECEQFPTCDVKAQTVLKVLRADRGLWDKIHDKLEVRLIKAAAGQEIVLHPKDEATARWSGKYHVYVTVQHGDERLVIDPYVGGENGCARSGETEFINHHWQGKAGEDFQLETLSPTEEIIDGDDYTPPFSLVDYINDHLDPDTYKAHQFFYELD